MPYKNAEKDRDKWPWIAQVRVTTSTGRQIKRKRRFKDKKQAQRWELEERERLLAEAEGDNSKTRIPSLLEWANRYLDACAGQAHATFTSKRLSFRLFFKSFDPELPITGLTRLQAFEHLQALALKKTGSVANRNRKNLCTAWNWGIEYMGLPESNPFSRLKRFAEERKPRRVPSYEDFLKVLEQVESQQDSIMLQTYLQTGARREELFRLRWEDVDLEGHRIRLRWRKNQLGEWREAWLPIQRELSAMLGKQKEIEGGEWVFTNQRLTGKIPFAGRNKWLGRLCRKAGVEPFGLHGIRHLFASVLANNPDVPLVEIQKMLRHTSLNTTQRYVHSLQGENRDVLEALPQVISEEVPTRLYGAVKRDTDQPQNASPKAKAPAKAPKRVGEQRARK